MSDAHAHVDTSHVHSDVEPVMLDEHGNPMHASRKIYFIVGFVLFAITGVEIGIFYLPQVQGILIPLLLVLSVVKFITVVQFFMHLRYDQKMLSRVFFGPLFLACLVVGGMIMLFKIIPKFAW